MTPTVLRLIAALEAARDGSEILTQAVNQRTREAQYWSDRFVTVIAERDEWKSVAENRSQRYFEARGAWQLASDDRAALEAQLEAAKAALAAAQAERDEAHKANGETWTEAYAKGREQGIREGVEAAAKVVLGNAHGVALYEARAKQIRDIDPASISAQAKGIGETHE